jgi:hypothetical protein
MAASHAVAESGSQGDRAVVTADARGKLEFFSELALPPATLADRAARKEPLRLSAAAGEITVDGVLDEPAWDSALVLEVGYEFSPADNTEAPVRTIALVTYDTGAFYVGFKAFDPEPDRIVANLSDRDDIWRDEQLGFEIDTFNDERRAYSIFINPLGVQEDSISHADGNFDFSWDAIWKAGTSFEPWGFSAEIEIPFSSIRFQRTDGPQVWGFNAMRAWVRGKRHDLGVIPIDRDNACRHCQLLKIEGFEDVKPGASVELIPAVTMTGSAIRTDFPAGDLEGQGEDVEVALTSHWGMTPGLTLSGTANPDFSQVEADALQLDINEPFALFYEEKRPFFSEGADFFRTHLNAVHTRSIRDPSWGVKLSGKEGRHTVGAFVVHDDVTNLLLPGPRGSSGVSLESGNTSTIVRYARDFGTRYTIGTLLSGREGGGYSNRVGGVDATLRLTDADRVSIQALFSSTEYPSELARDHGQPEGTFDDSGVILNYRHETRNVGWWASYQDMGEGFRADLGFIPQVGYSNLEGGTQYRWIAEPGKWWSQVTLGVKGESGEDRDGLPTRRDGGAWVQFLGGLQSWVYVGGSKGVEGFAGQEFDITDVEVSGGMRPAGNLQIGLHTWFGDQVDYRNARLGERVRVQPEVTLNITDHVEVDLRGAFEQMDVDGSRYYDALIAQLTLAYQFNVRTFLRATLQHVDYDYSVSLAKSNPVDEQRLLTQLLYSYKLNPRSVLFVGYTENAAGNEVVDLTASDRTLFVKIGYSLSL